MKKFRTKALLVLGAALLAMLVFTAPVLACGSEHNKTKADFTVRVSGYAVKFINNIRSEGGSNAIRGLAVVSAPDGRSSFPDVFDIDDKKYPEGRQYEFHFYSIPVFSPFQQPAHIQPVTGSQQSIDPVARQKSKDFRDAPVHHTTRGTCKKWFVPLRLKDWARGN